MKNLHHFLFFLTALCCYAVFTYAQVPQRINYQAVARNASGQTLINQAVSVRLSVRQTTVDGAIQYQETHNLITTPQGLINLQMGLGIPNSGTFTAITWTDGQTKFLQTELDPDGGAGAQPFIDMGTQQLLSVPYALYSEDVTWLRMSATNTSVGVTTYLLNGTSNTTVGRDALAFNTTGVDNTAIGRRTLHNNTIGHSNTAMGRDALFSNTEGNENTAIGLRVLFNNTLGTSNTAVGRDAVFFNTTGFNNTAIGRRTLYNNTTGQSNTAIGREALFSNTEGNENTAIGQDALFANTTGNQNTGLGRSANASSIVPLTNATAIGYGASVNASNKVRIGNTSVTVVEGPVVYTTSDARFKQNITEEVRGLDFITRLRPVVYNYKARQHQQFLMRHLPDSLQRSSINNMNFTPAETIRQSGFIAQEVETAAKAAGYDFNGLHTPQNPDDYYSLSYQQFVVPLVKAVQEQQTMIEELKKQNARLNNELQQIKDVLLQK